MHWNFAIFWINSQPNWTNVWASKTLVLDKTPERVFVGNWANQRFVQNMSKIPPHCVQLLIYFLSYTKDYRRKPKFIKEWVIKFRNKYVQKGFLNMKRVWAIAFFFFSMGLFAGFWITHDPMKIVICIGCDIIAYCLFFKWISIER